MEGYRRHRRHDARRYPTCRRRHSVGPAWRDGGLAGTTGGAEVEGLVSYEFVLNNDRLQGTLGTRSWSFDRAIDTIKSGAYPLDVSQYTVAPDRMPK